MASKSKILDRMCRQIERDDETSYKGLRIEVAPDMVPGSREWVYHVPYHHSLNESKGLSLQVDFYRLEDLVDYVDKTAKELATATKRESEPWVPMRGKGRC